MSPDVIYGILSFWVIIYLIALPLRSKGVKVSLFYVEISTKPERVPGISFLTKLVGRLTEYSPVVLFALMFLSAYFLLDVTLKSMLKPSEATPAVVPVIPGVTVSLDIPILLAIFLTLFPHELGHVISSLRNGVSVKKLSFFMLFIIPGAFVEPDESTMESLNWRKKANIFSSGVLMNVLVAILAILLAIAIFPGFPNNPSGVYVIEVQKGGPSYGILPNQVVITAIDQYEVRNLEDLHKVLEKHSPGDVVTIRTNLGDFRVKLGKSPYKKGMPWIGIKLSPFPYYKPLVELPPNLSLEILRTVVLISLFNISVGGLNSLPMYPLDGYHVTKELLIKKIGSEDATKGILWASSMLFLLLIAYNALLFFIR